MLILLIPKHSKKHVLRRLKTAPFIFNYSTGTFSHMKTGVLIVNLGTPDSPETGDVRKYLTEFLNDPRVIDISPIGRWLLVNLIIVPFRSSKSAKLYKEIW